MKATGVILAGGKSSRMGSDKSLLLIQDKPLIKLVVDELRSVFSDLLIVSNQRDKYSFMGIKEISDIYPGVGPLGGIHAALTHSDNEKIFVTACDMPFAKGKLAKLLLQESVGYDVTVPCIENYLQPLFAVYDKNCLPYIEDHLKKNTNKIIKFYSEVKVNYVGEKLIRNVIEPAKVFVNINYPQDYQEMVHHFKVFKNN